MDLAVAVRTKFGKATKGLRKEGLVAAELYGHGIPNVHLAVPIKDFQKVFKEAGENTVINLVLEGGKKHPVLIYDVQHDYVSDKIQHVDFYEVRMDEEIKAPIPIEFVGESPAVKNLGGVFIKSMEQVEVEALPAKLPQSFVVDISVLEELNHSIYVKDLKVPAGVKVLVEPETVIASIAEPRKEEEIVAPVEAVDVTAVKVESEEKAKERADEKAASGKEGAKEGAKN